MNRCPEGRRTIGRPTCREANQLQKENEALVACLRPLVEERACRANCQDILDVLPTTTDSDTFRRWLEELA